MAVHDDGRRAPSEYIDDDRVRYSDPQAGTRWAGVLVAIALIGFIGYMLFAAANGPSTTGDAIRQTPANPTTTTAPRTTTPATDTAPTPPSTR